ncbi:MAG: hypothetical protein MI725_02375 [Pirellulales bacterium]|nr:hypothetical protein [Pirellulales bacterium]
MLSLHETAQRRLCRLLFLVCCVLPTLLTLGWIAHFYRPWRLSDWQQTLSQRLHVRTTAGHISSPRPGVTILTNVRLADLRSEEALGGLDKVQAVWQNSRLSLHAKNLEIEAQQLPQAAEALATWLSVAEFVPVTLEVDRVDFVSQANSQDVWKNFRLTSERQAEQTKRITLQFEPGIATSSARLILEHQQGVNGPVIHAELDTQQSSLPVRLLADLVPGGVHRSRNATFTGNTQIEWDTQQVRGTLQGRFARVDLAQWLRSSTPHRLQGAAALEIENLVWQDERIQLVEGRLQANDGAANSSLLEAASALLHCAKTQALERSLTNRSGELVTFDQLAFAFRVDHTGLRITGRSMPGCLLAHQGEPLLLEPPSKLPVTRLVRLLYLPVAGWLPDTHEAHEMAGGLPLPSGTR